MAKYMFEWCGECDCLKACYYQHGVKSSHPFALDPDCTKGPYKDDYNPDSEMDCCECGGDGCPLCMSCGGMYSPGTEECEFCEYRSECAS